MHKINIGSNTNNAMDDNVSHVAVFQVKNGNNNETRSKIGHYLNLVLVHKLLSMLSCACVQDNLKLFFFQVLRYFAIVNYTQKWIPKHSSLYFPRCFHKFLRLFFVLSTNNNSQSKYPAKPVKRCHPP